jgi:hypothetical protein
MILLMTQGTQRIDAQGFSGRQNCRDRDGYDEDCDGGQVRRRIEIADAVQPSAQGAIFQARSLPV